MEAYLQLRELIVDNRLPAGAPIIEAQAAKQLGYTRLTLRSALQRLQQEGYVSAVQLGTYTRSIVAPLTVADMTELFEITGSIEGLALRRIAVLEDAVREKALRQIGALNDKLLRYVDKTGWDPVHAFTLDHAFHRSMVEHAGGRLLRHYDAIRPQMDRYHRLYTTRGLDRLRNGFHEHVGVVDAIAAGEPDVAERTVREHYRNAANRLRPRIEERGEFQRLGG